MVSLGRMEKLKNKSQYLKKEPMGNLNTEIEKAFDYRGNVTLHLKDGRHVVGYIYNREAKGSSRCSEPFVEMMLENNPEKSRFKYSEIASIAFTGEDPAAGKSWEEWLAKEDAKKKAVPVKV